MWNEQYGTKPTVSLFSVLSALQASADVESTYVSRDTEKLE